MAFNFLSELSISQKNKIQFKFYDCHLCGSAAKFFIIIEKAFIVQFPVHDFLHFARVLVYGCCYHFRLYYMFCTRFCVCDFPHAEWTLRKIYWKTQNKNDERENENERTCSSDSAHATEVIQS